jgi:hypothetical protein
MEVLPEEIATDILFLLPEDELYVFGSCSKHFNYLSKLAWKKKMAILIGGYKNLNLRADNTNWYRCYYDEKRSIMFRDIRELCNQIHDYRSGDYTPICNIYNYVFQNYAFIRSKRYKTLCKVLRNKLLEFIKQSDDFERIGMAYLEKLFPRTYRKLYDYDLDKFFVEE